MQLRMMDAAGTYVSTIYSAKFTTLSKRCVRGARAEMTCSCMLPLQRYAPLPLHIDRRLFAPFFHPCHPPSPTAKCSAKYPLRIGITGDIGQTDNSTLTRDYLLRHKPQVYIQV